MEAKDTVMTWKQTCECSHNPVNELRERDITERQAEISFKAGYDEGINDKVGFGLSVHGAAILVGRKEVVDWVELNTKQFQGYPYMDPDKWQAKLKDWGI